jgi:ferredoxin-thioredoxin reductase catalytic subunit
LNDDSSLHIEENIKRKELKNMAKIRLNEDKEIVETVKEGLKAKGGFCPCKVGKKPENKCMCEEFKAQIADPDFEGYCHCMLYYKSKD